MSNTNIKEQVADSNSAEMENNYENMNTNPLSTLSLQELKQLIESFDKKFAVKKINDQVVEDCYTKYFDIFNNFIKYIVDNKITIKKGDEELNLTYGCMAELLIRAEHYERLTFPKENQMEQTNNKQSSVEWFNQELKNLLSKYGFISEKILSIHFNRAKAMHKEEIMEAHYAPQYGCFSKDYYNETFGGEE